MLRMVTYLDHNHTFVKADCNLVRILAESCTPSAFQCVAEGIFYSICAAVPDLDGSVLTTTDNYGEIGMKDGKGDIVGMALHRLNTAFTQVIPDFDSLVIASGDKVRFIGARVKVNIVDSFIMCVHGKIGSR
jgi:hypothetical protein